MPSEDPSEHSVHGSEHASAHHDEYPVPNPFIQQMTGLFQQIVQNVIPTNNGDARESITIEKLKKNGASIFFGKRGDTPEIAEFWLEQTARVLEDLQVLIADRSRHAISLLQHGAYDWWKSVLLRPDLPRPVTWDYFQERFIDQFVPAWYQEERKRQFMDLTQGSMTVAEYAYEFLRLSKYAPDMVRMEADKCRKFEYGLNEEIAGQVVTLRHVSFTLLVGAAQSFEGWRRRKTTRGTFSYSAPPMNSTGKRHESGKGKSQSRYNESSRAKSTSGSNKPRPPVSQVKSVPLCSFCSKHHIGECRRASGACFRCGQKGHMLRECPLLVTGDASSAPVRPTHPPQMSQQTRIQGNAGSNSDTVKRPTQGRPQARTYAMQAREEQPENDVIIG
ncbi:unnamed protein product [Cuscuta epithymum]|uniref:CCHC-type domain-containing protein n=1 Tax=Cuscuta epithymum TaxID=186058 RepID=A0AAV0EQK6_9ASTE|nr:unnamed protein product [Cuscuta epithymum]